MCDNLLKSVLLGKIKSNIIIKWLKNETLKEDESDEVSSYDCLQGEFILYFLNYLHEETSGVLQSFSSQMTPNRIRTPRRVENFASKSNYHNDSRKTSRRTALFPDKQNKNEINCLGIASLDIENAQVNHSQQSSTPKVIKGRSSLDHSLPLDLESPFKNSLNQMSPISPIYTRNRSTSDIKNKSGTPKTSSRRESSNFCLGDFIVTKSTNKHKKQKVINLSEELDSSLDLSLKKLNIENTSSFNNSFNSNNSSTKTINPTKRRINPTSLINLSTNDTSNSNRITPQNTKNSFSFQKLSEIDSPTKNSRESLLEERLKILSRSKSETNTDSNMIPVRKTRSTSICIVQPNLDSVTNKSQLDILAQIYSLLIDLNLVLNTLSELYFLITLILIKADNCKRENNNKDIEELRKTLKHSLTDSNDEIKQKTEGLFKNIHNCVYFAANVLSKQFHLLSVLDRATLKLLQENIRIQIFAPNLVNELMVYRVKKTDKKPEISVSHGIENVSFISDTDNRENFSSDSSFHTFRKQRDLFYNILSLWETNHLQSNWDFSLNLGNKIRQLILMHPDPVNSMHLARLFKNQLLADCSQFSELTPLPSCLNALTNLNVEKLSLLQNRLVSKQSTGGPSPEPSFPGKQEFYKEFIKLSDSPKFHRHLIDCFCAEILQLNDTSHWPSDIDDTSTVVDPVFKKIYLNSLVSLKVLAKFLGYIDAFAYKIEYIPNHQILTTQISVRSHFMPSINIINIFNESLKLGKLSLTIPWITDYLAMLDHITLRLPYFSTFVETLFELHYSSDRYFKFISYEQILMIKLCLGWLFERPNFPLESYQNWISKKYQQKSLNEIVPFSNGFNISNGYNSISIDCLDIIDETILFTCCPYLIEIKNILISDPSSNYNNSGSVKYIRPVSTVGENSDFAKKRLQKQLEEAFFHNQPVSTRKTIDLITERVTSACVKHICNNLVPEAKIKYLNKFRNHLEHVTKLNFLEAQNEIDNCCAKYAKEFAEKYFEEFQISLKNEISNFTKLRCDNSLKALLADDVHPIARASCVSISVQQSQEKIEQWYKLHVDSGIFLKEFISEMDNFKQNSVQNSKKLTYKLPSKGKNVDHNPEAHSPVILLINIREQMYKIHEKSHEIELIELNQLLDNASDTCQRRCDLNQVAQFTSCRLFYDMFFMLASKRPELACDQSYIVKLVEFWDKFLHKSEKIYFFDRILCPRNACIFEHSSDTRNTWLACELLIKELFNKQLLKLEQFEKQTIAMFRYEWSSNTIKNFTQCLQNVIDEYVRKNGTQENFTFILQWIADYCNDDEFF